MTGRLRVTHELSAVPDERVGDYVLPRTFRLHFDDAGSGPSLRADFEVRDGSAQCRAIHVFAHEDGEEISTKHVRNIHVDDLRDHAISRVGMVVEEYDQNGSLVISRSIDESQVSNLLKTARVTRSARRTEMSSTLLYEVASVYRGHEGRAPTRAVAQHVGKSLRTAGLYVKRAREAGLLDGPQS